MLKFLNIRKCVRYIGRFEGIFASHSCGRQKRG
jgi:hypothetical protein